MVFVLFLALVNIVANILTCISYFICRHYGSNVAIADDRYLENDNDGDAQFNKQSTFGSNINNLTNTNHNTNGHNKSHTKRSSSGNKHETEKALMLLDPINRPIWNGTSSPSKWLL